MWRSIKDMETQMAIKSEREKIGICPQCGGDIFEGEKNYFCHNYKEENGGCSCSFNKKVYGVEMSRDVMSRDVAKTLFNSKKTDFFEGMKEGYPVRFRFEIFDKEIKVCYDDTKPIGKCPLCKRNVYPGKKHYYCEGYNKEPPCTFNFWKNQAGRIFTVDEVTALINGEELQKKTIFVTIIKRKMGGVLVHSIKRYMELK